VDIQKRIFKFVTRTNWVLLALVSVLGAAFLPPDYAWGLFCGGLLVTVNFHLLSKTLKKALTPSHLSSHNVVIAKYYIRFLVSGVVIFVLIQSHFVHPVGLIIGLSVVVVSIMAATVREIKKLIFKEAM
jgi:hypothetical protein